MKTTRPVLLALLLVGVAACSAGEGEEGADSTAEGPATLRLAMTSQITTLNPLPGAVGQNFMAHQLLWDALVGTDSNNEYEPRLAESWDISEDGREWTFHIREDVAWSDGQPLTAHDVVFTYELLADPASGSGYAGYFQNVVGVDDFREGDAESISGFHAPDDHTFVIELAASDAGFLESLTTPALSVLPEHVYGEIAPADLGENELFREPPVGLGPYVFEQWVNDDQLELRANPEYRQELGFDRVFLLTMNTDAALAQLERGDVDFANVTAADVDRVEALDGVTVHRIRGVGPSIFASSLDSGPLEDVRVRQAILHAIDREAIVDQVLRGEGEVVDSLSLGPDWAMPDDLIRYEHDPARAEALLAAAGWDPATEVRLEVWPGSRERETVATIVAAELQEVGIDARVVNLELAELLERMDERDFDMVFSAAGNFSRDPSAMNLRLMCDQAPPMGINSSAYCNPELDALLERGISTADQDERAEIYHEAIRVVNHDVPTPMLYVPNVLAATGPNLSGYETNPEGFGLFWNAADWRPAR